jgi:hypothetical protein
MEEDNYNSRHPDSYFNAAYPYNKVTQTGGGHEIHIDDTPGSERLKIAHTTGTYAEIGPAGDLNQVVVGKTNMYFADGHTTTIDGHKDEKILGNYSINCGNNSSTGSLSVTTTGGPIIVQTDDAFAIGGVFGDIMTTSNFEMGIGGDLNIQVDGQKSEVITDDSTEQVLGNKSIIVTGDIDLSGFGVSVTALVDDVTVAAPLTINMASGVRTHIGSEALITIITPTGVVTIDAGGAVTINAGGAISLIAGGEINMTAGGAININAGGAIEIAAGGTISAFAPLITLN